MVDVLAEMFGDELRVLEADRRAHSLAVGRKAASVAELLPASMRADLVTAATLHDVGYGHPEAGFHPLDGANYLAASGFSRAVCHLVVHHSASTIEAEERGFSLGLYEAFASETDLSAAHSVVWWADMTTGPQGQDVTVEHRLDEICSRYGPDDVVSRFIARAREVLLEAGQSPVGSIHVPV